MENSIPERLSALKKLQEIDSKLDEVKKLRGALPEEVQDLEDEVAGFTTRQEKYNEEIAFIEQDIATHKTKTKEAEHQIEIYEEQQNNIKNNREYDAISKEIEYQKLEIQLLEQKTKKSYQLIEDVKVFQLETSDNLAQKHKLLSEKKEELGVLIAESKSQEVIFQKEREEIKSHVEERLLSSYEKIRANARNGLAVVSVRRSACGGCFNVVPPQRQAEIHEKKKILVCEHCGRILCDVLVEDAPIPKKKITRRKATPKTKFTPTATPTK